MEEVGELGSTGPRRSKKRVRQRAVLTRLASTLFLVSIVLVGGTVFADPKVIDARDGFPSEDLPLGEPFSVTLEPDETTKAAHGLFLEYADGIFGSKAGSEIEYCSQLEQVATPIYTSFATASRGEARVAALFDKAPQANLEKWNGLKSRKAFLLPSWHRPDKPPEGEAPPPTLRVPRTTFFQRGARYCFIVVEEKTRTATSVAVEKLLQKVSARIDSCTDPEGQKDVCIASALAPVAAAKRGLSAEERRSLRENLGPALAVASRRRALVELLAKLEQTPPLLPDVRADHPFGVFVASVLTARAGEAPLDCKVGSNESMARIDVLTRPASITWASKGPPAAQVARSCDLTKVPVGKAANGLGQATLADFLALATGQVMVNGKAVSFGDLKRQSMADAIMNQPERVSDDYEAVVHWLAPMATVLEEDSPDADIKAARAWAASVSADWVLDSDTNKNSVSPGVLFVKTKDLHRALLSWSPALTRVSKTVGSFELSSIDVSVGLTPNTWVFSFLTPTIGYATTSDSFGLPILTLQLFLFPNSADEPMWTNGSRDWRRAFSLQAGIATTTETFGPNNRYEGPGDLPPFLVGLGVNVIPYVTLSGGALFVDAKKSTLPEETGSFHPLFYFSASVQTNIPDIVATLIAGKNTKGE